MTSKRAVVAGVVALAAVAAGSAFALTRSSDRDKAAGTADGTAEVRTATAAFRDRTAATAAGYAELRDAKGVACIDNPAGGMGIHYVNGDLVADPAESATTPEALVYEPQPDGTLALVAVEYVVIQADWEKAGNTEPPSLFGRTFEAVAAGNRFGLPPFYALHAWLWKDNPSGKFADWNPDVKCSDADGTEAARVATAAFRDNAAAVGAGYGELKDAKGVACIDDAAGGMGIHYVKKELVGDPAVVATKPEALVYEPQPDGKLALVAVEYVVLQADWAKAGNTAPPSLFGREFDAVGAGNRFGLPPFYALHAWLWKDNPSGTFAGWNPDVSCRAA
ncbi:MAG TPA: hypothetical protein VNA12_09135 [Mycobacteriales bacterium]|nr:hypothetical protein [Mycobacteriales bacterium]